MKKKTLVSVISICLFMIIGVSYAYFSYQRIGRGNEIVTGQIYMDYVENNEIFISKVFPETEEEAFERTDNVFNFEISGKNTSTKDLYYGISLNYGNEREGMNRIKPEDIMIYLERDGEVLIDGIRYSDWDNQRIWVEKIDAKTNTETTKKYSLRMWVDENVKISDTNPNANYTAEYWNNAYASLKVNVDGKTSTMNMPLSIETSDTYVENNNAYLIAKISNFYDMNELGKTINESDEMNLEITGTNADIVFSYKDNEGNVVEETTENLDLNYIFNKNKTIEIQVFVIPKNDANGITDLSFKLTKNGELIQNFRKYMRVYGNNFCLNNGLNKLYDCILASDSLETNIETAKVNIANKGEVNLNDTAPSYTYVEETTTNVSNAYTISSGHKYYFSDSYEFNSTTGKFKLTGTIITDSLSDSYLNYYTCGASSSNCATIYKILGTDSTTQKITLADKTTYKIATTLRSEVGLYKTEDDFGDAYFYRGDVTNNNVYFAGFYWKIIRTNGDGTIRLIYQGTSPIATGNNTSINGKVGQYNKFYPDPTYVGYMYGNNFSETEVVSPELTDSSFAELTEYYFGDDYTYDEATKLYQLKQTSDGGNLKKGTLTAMQDEFGTYKYTCKGTSEDSTCQYMTLINSYRTATSINGSHITYPITNLDDIYENNVSSTIKDNLETWYKTNIVDKMDSDGISYAKYVVNQRFCNERTISSPVKLNADSTINTSYSEYKINTTVTYSRYRTLCFDANKTASLKCNNISDSFSAKGTDSNKGNGLLEYPIGLITADEVALAGGKYNTTNLNYYLTTGGNFRTMTPSYFDPSYARAYVWGIYPDGEMIYGFNVSSYLGVRAVINLNSDILIANGDGTIENPFQLMVS